MQKEYIKYGVDNFSFEILFSDDVDYDIISKKEQEYIKIYDSYLNGYNQNEGGNFGPSNGGSHLVESDILNILSALEFISRPGQILADMYDVSRTTISRIKKGENHSLIKSKYDNLPLKERKEIYKILCDSTNFYETKVNTTIIQSKRKLSEEQVHLIFYNEEKNRILSLDKLANKLNIKSSNTLYTILQGKSYKDYKLSYNKLTIEQKNRLASLLSN